MRVGYNLPSQASCYTAYCRPGARLLCALTAALPYHNDGYPKTTNNNEPWDSEDQRDRLGSENLAAGNIYFCNHTKSYSYYNFQARLLLISTDGEQKFKVA